MTCESTHFFSNCFPISVKFPLSCRKNADVLPHSSHSSYRRSAVSSSMGYGDAKPQNNPFIVFVFAGVKITIR